MLLALLLVTCKDFKGKPLTHFFAQRSGIKSHLTFIGFIKQAKEQIRMEVYEKSERGLVPIEPNDKNFDFNEFQITFDSKTKAFEMPAQTINTQLADSAGVSGRILISDINVKIIGLSDFASFTHEPL